MPALIEVGPRRFLRDLRGTIVLIAHLVLAVAPFLAILAVALYVDGDTEQFDFEVINSGSNCTTIPSRYLRNIKMMEDVMNFARRANGDITPMIMATICALLVNAAFLDWDGPAKDIKELMPYVMFPIWLVAIFALGLLERIWPTSTYSFFGWPLICLITELVIRLILVLFSVILGRLHQFPRLFQRFRIFVIRVIFRMRG